MADDLQSDSIHHGGKTVLIAMAVFAILSIAASATSEGFLEADAASHHLYARYAFHSLFYLVNPWGRPLATFLYAIGIAAGGRTGAQTIALICALGCAFVAGRIAIAQNRRPELAVLFTLGQPLLFFHSFSEMTELPFALVLGLAFLAYRLQRWGLLAAAAALLPLGRPEGFGFCLLAGLLMIIHRRWAWLALLVLPTILWDYAGWIAEGRHGAWWLWLAHSWPYAAASDYARGSLFHFVMVLPALISPAATPAVCIGVARVLRRRSNQSAFYDRLIAAIPVGVLIAHSLLYGLGRLSSNGELRYLLIASPFWGLLAASGWEWIFDRFHWRQPAAWAAFALLLPAQLNWIIPVVPLPLSETWQSAQRVLTWYDQTGLRRQYPHLLFSHPAFDYYLNSPPDDPVRATAWSRQAVLTRPRGTLLIWDGEFSDKNADPTRDATTEQIISAGWKPTSGPAGIDPRWRLFVSEPGQ